MPETDQRKKIPMASILIAGFSTVVEWYDFTLYIYFATVLSRVFYGGGATSLITTLGGFAIAYLMRPLGAFVFGHIGDRLGRRQTLLISMAVMSAAMLLIAILPTTAQIGPMAGMWLLGLRCVMSFAVGGEYTGVVAYLLEGASVKHRGLVASLAAAASEIGALMAASIAAVTVSLFSEHELGDWGWRIPFGFGAVLALVVWIMRSNMHESPDFERQRLAGSLPDAPLIYTLKHNFSSVFRSFAISALGSITYYVGIGYVPSFVHSVGALREDQALGLSTVAALVVILVTPFVGILSDQYGRKPVLIVLGLLSAVLPVSLFGLMASGSALLGAVILATLAGGISAVGAVTTAELFPVEGRLSGLALGATVATAIFGGLTPFLAQLLIARTHNVAIPGMMIALVAVIVLPILIQMPESAPLKFGKHRI